MANVELEPQIQPNNLGRNMGELPPLDMNDPEVQSILTAEAEKQGEWLGRKLRLQNADKEDLIQQKLTEALLRAPQYDESRGITWFQFLRSKMMYVGTDWIQGPARLPKALAQHIRRMRAEFGDDVEAAWAVTEPKQMKGFREFAPFFNAFMIASSTVAINQQGDLVGSTIPDSSSVTGVTPVSLVSPDTADRLDEQIINIYEAWLSSLSEVDQEIWTLYKSPYFEMHGYRGIERALTIDPSTGAPLATKSTIERHVKTMLADLEELLGTPAA